MKDSQPQTTTTTQEPPAWLEPYLQFGAGQARNLFQQGGPGIYPGQTVTPFSPITEQALAMQSERAMQGSPLVDAAQQYTQSVIEGDYLNNNPYLDDAFDKAAQATRNQLTSQFASSGRDIGAAQLGGLRGEQLNNLATDIYGNAYENERKRQQQAIAFASPLAQQDYFDISQLRNVGAQVEDLSGRVAQDAARRYDYYQNLPYQNLQNYMSTILNPGYGGVTAQSTPTQSSPLGGALGGGLMGAGLFGAGGPLAGTLGMTGPMGFGIGAGLGLLGLI